MITPIIVARYTTIAIDITIQNPMDINRPDTIKARGNKMIGYNKYTSEDDTLFNINMYFLVPSLAICRMYFTSLIIARTKSTGNSKSAMGKSPQSSIVQIDSNILALPYVLMIGLGVNHLALVTQSTLPPHSST